MLPDRILLLESESCSNRVRFDLTRARLDVFHFFEFHIQNTGLSSPPPRSLILNVNKNKLFIYILNGQVSKLLNNSDHFFVFNLKFKNCFKKLVFIFGRISNTRNHNIYNTFPESQHSNSQRAYLSKYLGYVNKLHIRPFFIYINTLSTIFCFKFKREYFTVPLGNSKNK